MNSVNVINPEQIVALKDLEAARLLLKLLTLEAERNGLPLSGVSVPLNITVADGGEDARVEWEGGPSHTNWLPDKSTIFQIKATYMGIKDCGEEILRRAPQAGHPSLKPKVHEVFQKGGCYVLFYTNQILVDDGIDKRAQSVRNAIEESAEFDKDKCNVKIYDATLIANWTNQFPQAVTFVTECAGITKPIPFDTWDEWADRREYSYPFIANERGRSYIEAIKKTLQRPKSVQRIVGLSGLGKTRLVLEALRPPFDGFSKGQVLQGEELDQKTLSDSVIYYDAVSPPPNLRDYVVDLCQRGVSGVLVIDNCDMLTHNIIAKEIIERNKSNLSFLSIDSNPEHADEVETYIHLKPEDFEDIVPEFLRKVIPGMSDADISRIQEFAQGFPLVAVLLAKDLEAKKSSLGRLNDTQLVHKLLGKQLDTETLNVIKACAIFENLGFEADYMEQRNSVATSDLISKLTGNDEVRKNKFYEVGKHFLERGIIERRGRKISVRPRPLALRLAAEWWEQCRPESVEEVLLQVIKFGLVEQLCNQIAFLDFLPAAREITKSLCGDRGPFGQAKVLNSELGSRLFRSLVEVNPEACTEAVSRVYSSFSVDQLRKVVDGRRNLVWSLEKLCFWEKTFPRAARVMMAFAAGENETWGNNATNQFLELFHIRLSGTQAPPSERLSLIDESLSRPEIEFRRLAVKALGHAIQTHNFTRVGGVEKQGSRMPQDEWKPKVWGEAFSYWRAALEKLATLAKMEDELGELARDEIARSLRGLVSFGRLDEIESALKAITAARGPFWPKALESVRQALQFEGPKIPEDAKANAIGRLESWERMLQPQSTPDRMRQLVSLPSWHHVRLEEGGRYSDLAEKEAADLANELAESPDTLFEHLAILYEGEQRRGFVFGYTLGSRMFQPERFTDQSLEILRRADPSKANSDVLAGFLRGVQPNDSVLVSHVFTAMTQDEKLHIHAVNVARVTDLELPDLLRLIGLVDEKKIEVRSLKALSYGRPLSHLTPNEATTFSHQLKALGVEGAAVALDILQAYVFQNDELFKACTAEFREIVLTPQLLLQNEPPNQLDIYDWEEVTKRLLKQEPKDIEFALQLSAEILQACETDRDVFEIREPLGKVLEILLVDYRDQIWPSFAAGLLSEDARLHYNVSSLFEGRSGFQEEGNNLLTSLSPEFLLDWARRNQERAPEVLARLTPLYSEDSGVLTWHALAKSLIDEFGDRKEVLSAIFANMMSFGSIGSIIPYYQHRIEALRLLVSHPRQEVRSWVRATIGTLDQEITNEKQREEERGY